MTFSKSFPLQIDGAIYPTWVETELTAQEEKAIEEECKKENTDLLKRSIDDARKVFEQKKLKTYQTDVVNAALALFIKNASHVHFWKEEKAKDKFDRKYKKFD